MYFNSCIIINNESIYSQQIKRLVILTSTNWNQANFAILINKLPEWPKLVIELLLTIFLIYVEWVADILIHIWVPNAVYSETDDRVGFRKRVFH